MNTEDQAAELPDDDDIGGSEIELDDDVPETEIDDDGEDDAEGSDTGEGDQSGDDEDSLSPIDKAKAGTSKGVQRRIDELTAQREAAEAAHKAALAELEKLRGASTAPADDDRPDPREFPLGVSDPDYQDALEAYREAQFQRRTQAMLEAYAKEQAQNAEREQFAAREREYAAAHPRYDEAKAALLAIPELRDSVSLGEALKAADDLFGFVEHIASTPGVANRLARMTPAQAVKEVARIEARMGTGSQAPKPPSSTRVSGRRAVVNSDQLPADGSMDRYIAVRRKEGALY